MQLRNALAGAVLLVLSISQLKGQQKYSWHNLPRVAKPVFKKDTFNIKSYGAKPDGSTLNTANIQQAVDACSQKGGGVVLIPAGLWVTGPIQLKSNVNLHLDRSALLQFTDDKSKYALVMGNYEGHKAVRNQSPISGTDLTNVAITGDGIIDGHGEAWRAMGKNAVTEQEWKQLLASGGELSSDGKMWYPSKSYAEGAQTKNAGYIEHGKSAADYEEIKDFFRPNLIVFNNCRNVLLQSTTFENSPGWCLHTLACENLTFEGVHVRNLPNAQNGDAMDIESCSYVLVENCILDAGDDAICIKSGKDEEGRKFGKPSQYMVVRNNVVYRGHGGFVIGSEMSGGAHDIFVSNCTFIGTDNGLRFKTVRGRGGVVANIYIKDITMRAIVSDAVLFDMYYFAKAPALAQTNGVTEIPAVNEGTPRFRNFYISNVVCDGANRAMLIRGLPEMAIKDIHLDHVYIKSHTGADIIDAQAVSLHGVTLDCDVTRPLINVENSRELVLDGIEAKKAPDLFLSVNGDRCKEITLKKSNIADAKHQVDFNYGAARSALAMNP